MTNKPDTELTLPSVVADLAGGYRPSQLMLTISFHPDPGRVGEAAILPLGRGKQHWELGRNKPEFCPRDEMSNQLAGSPIDDPGISRKALRLEYSKDSRHVILSMPGEWRGTDSRTDTEWRPIKSRRVYHVSSSGGVHPARDIRRRQN